MGAAESRSLGLGHSMPGATSSLLLLLLLLPLGVSGAITHATCQISEQDPQRGFLPSLPLRTAPQVVTTALVTGILGMMPVLLSSWPCLFLLTGSCL